MTTPRTDCAPPRTADAPPPPVETSGTGSEGQGDPNLSRRFLARAALLTAALSIAGSLLGLVRDQSLARLFGAGSDTDAFLGAWTVSELPLHVFEPPFFPPCVDRAQAILVHIFCEWSAPLVTHAYFVYCRTESLGFCVQREVETALLC